jgi:hypothetical protein
MGGTDFSTERPLESFKSLQLGPWPGYTEKPIGGDQIPVRGLIGGEGEVGKRFRSSRRSRGWPVLRTRGAETASRRRTGADGGTPRDGDGILVAGVPEGGGEVTRKLPRDDVVLMVCLVGAERRRSVGTTARPSGGGARAHRRGGSAVLAWESEIGWACEHQWAAAVLLEHWIGGGRRQRRLTTVSRSYGGAPARRRAREEERQRKCECVKARVRSQDAQGHASSRGGGTASESRCWQARRRAWRLGRRRRDVEEQGEAQRGVGSGGRGAGAARGAGKSDAGQLELGKSTGEGGEVGAERNRERRELEVDDGDLAAIFQKCRDSIVKSG